MRLHSNLLIDKHGIRGKDKLWHDGHVLVTCHGRRCQNCPPCRTALHISPVRQMMLCIVTSSVARGWLQHKPSTLLKQICFLLSHQRIGKSRKFPKRQLLKGISTGCLKALTSSPLIPGAFRISYLSKADFWLKSERERIEALTEWNKRGDANAWQRIATISTCYHFLYH